jgi:hypothetical protein
MGFKFASVSEVPVQIRRLLFWIRKWITTAGYFRLLKGDANMVPTKTPTANREQAVPAMQRVLDNPFLLLFLGIVVPTVFYILWGVMEIVTIPISN